MKLEPGTYQYQEIKAPEGYILNDTMYKFTVSEEGQVIFMEETQGIIYNKKAEVEVPPKDDDEEDEPVKEDKPVEDDEKVKNEIKEPKPTDTTTSKTETLPYTGISENIVIILIMLLISIIYNGIKLKKNKDI